MPLYEYVCASCGEVFETLVRADERELGVECPRCGAKAAERRFSTFSPAGARTVFNPGTFVRRRGGGARHQKPPGT